MSDSTERNCNKCIHHISGMCDSWNCNMQTVEDSEKEAVNEYVKSVVAELEQKISDMSFCEYRDAFIDAIEIVKQGGATKSCNNCANYTESDEVDNGCYLCCKGYEDNYEPKVDNGGVGKDVEQMKETGIVRRFDDLGRIVIPKEMRRQIFGTKCTDGEPMEIFIDGDSIILRKYEEISDDACEWTQSGDMAINPHTFSKYKIKQCDGLYALSTCPYCRKNIKVVG